MIVIACALIFGSVIDTPWWDNPFQPYELMTSTEDDVEDNPDSW